MLPTRAAKASRPDSDPWLTTLGGIAERRYIVPMEMLHSAVGRTITAALAALAVAIITGAAFAGWMNHGAEVFLTYTVSGLAWCL